MKMRDINFICAVSSSNDDDDGSKAGSLAFAPPGDETSQVVSRCLPHRQKRVSNLSKVATQWPDRGRFEP